MNSTQATLPSTMSRARDFYRTVWHRARRLLPGGGASLTLAAALLAALPYSPDADARGRRFGVFIGGVAVGAAFAPRYVYSAPYYYVPPPVYYAPYPAYAPVVTYVQPPVIVQQAAPAASAPLASAPPVTAPAAPAQSATPAVTPTAAMSIEDRLRRLRSMCDQGLFTEAECRNRREQILQEL